MRWNKHLSVEGTHAILSCSQNSWIRKSDEDFDEWVNNSKAAEEGTKLHAIAKQLIDNKIKVKDSKTTFGMYVNDAIGFKMEAEQPLYFSENCFGTADAISFKNNFLRIHDLKTGDVPAHMEQLMIYEALFCLEYQMDPNKFGSELRIYQSDDVLIDSPDPKDIEFIMDKIIFFDQKLNKMKEEGN